MSWLFFFVFTIASLNTIVIYSLFKRLGFEIEGMLIASLVCLLSACVAYDFAMQDVVKLLKQGNYYVQK